MKLWARSSIEQLIRSPKESDNLIAKTIKLSHAMGNGKKYMLALALHVSQLCLFTNEIR